MSAVSDPLVLSIDTATSRRSVAIMRGTRVLAYTHSAEPRAATSGILVEIDEALRVAHARLEEIELFAAASGPGSFTGLRAGLATIKSFAATLARPVVGVPTLHAVAFASGRAPRLLAAIPAGRGEVFAQLLAVTREGTVEELEPARHLDPTALLAQALDWHGEVRWAGEGAHVHAKLLREGAWRAGIEWQLETENTLAGMLRADTIWTLAPAPTAYAREVGALATRAERDARVQDAASLRAQYVRMSDAELKEQCRQ